MTDILNIKVNGEWVGIPALKGDQGPQGRQGEGVAPGGTTGQFLVKSSNEDYATEWVNTHFTYTQAIPSDTWTINHNLNKKPSVIVVDSAGNVQIPDDIQITSDNSITIKFIAAFSGEAYLN